MFFFPKQNTCIKQKACLDCRWGVKLPAIVASSIAILSDGGLGMAMFSLGIEKKCVYTTWETNIIFLCNIFWTLCRAFHGKPT